MAKFLDNFNDALTQWFDGLNDREKRLLIIFASALTGILLFATIGLATSKINDKKNRLEKANTQVLEIRKLQGQYLSAKAKSDRELRSIKNNTISLYSFLQSVTKRLGLAVSTIEEQQRPIPKTDIVEVSAKLNLSKLSIDKVSALIESLETEDARGRVRVTRLKIEKRRDEPDLLDIQMTVSTWKSV